MRTPPLRASAIAALLLLTACTPPGDGTNAPSNAPRWPVIGAFEHFNERIEGAVWLDEARNELRFELKGVETRLKCVGPGEIDSSILGENQCRQVEGDFSLHCGVQRELFGSFEFNECDFGFAAGIDTLTGSTVAMHFAVADDRAAALQTYYSDIATRQIALPEPGEYLESSGLDPEIYSLGTGFAITEDGIILTAAHVVDDQYGLRVHAGERVSDATIIAIDRDADLALLQTDLEFEPLPLMEPTEVSAFAFAGRAIGYRMSAGAAPIQTQESAFVRYPDAGSLYAFEGDIIPGYSGGPLMAVPDNKVIGVLHAISVQHSMTGWINYDINKIALAIKYDAMMKFLESSLDKETMQDVRARSHGPGALLVAAGSDAIVLVTVY